MGKSSVLTGATSPLRLATYEGSGQCVHPDVIGIARAFYGRELLMVMEPYPYGNDYFENPSLLVSDDGLHWFLPEALLNPVVDPPRRRGAWNSDGDLLIDRDHRLVLYYRYNSGRGETTLLRKTTSDGLHWSQAENIFTVPVSGTFASPALVHVGARYHMYYVDTLEQRVKLAISQDGTRWEGNRTLFSFEHAWHVDATQSGDCVYILLNDKKSLFLLKSADQRMWSILDGGEWRPYSYLGGGFQPILGPSEGSWDDGLIYRSTLLVENDVLRLWYGAKSTDNVWQVGYVDGPLGG
jgi:predicted GH43/DUF377 family glycosyl hydrolase